MQWPSLAATPVEQAIDHIAAERGGGAAALEYEKLVRDVAVRGGVLPKAVDRIVPDVQKRLEKATR